MVNTQIERFLANTQNSCCASTKKTLVNLVSYMESLPDRHLSSQAGLPAKLGHMISMKTMPL